MQYYSSVCDFGTDANIANMLIMPCVVLLLFISLSYAAIIKIEMILLRKHIRKAIIIGVVILICAYAPLLCIIQEYVSFVVMHESSNLCTHDFYNLIRVGEVTIVNIIPLVVAMLYPIVIIMLSSMKFNHSNKSERGQNE
jgi:hypothetical protein